MPAWTAYAVTSAPRRTAKWPPLGPQERIVALIDLLVRGMCYLRPGVLGASDSIRVTGVVDRFLDRARILSFADRGKREVCLSSADWMLCDLERRVEVTFPIENDVLRDRVFDEIIGVALPGNVKARRPGPDASDTLGSPAALLRQGHPDMDLQMQLPGKFRSAIANDHTQYAWKGPTPTTPERKPAPIPASTCLLSYSQCP